jgi:hypothetical protein
MNASVLMSLQVLCVPMLEEVLEEVRKTAESKMSSPSAIAVMKASTRFDDFILHVISSLAQWVNECVTVPGIAYTAVRVANAPRCHRLVLVRLEPIESYLHARA